MIDTVDLKAITLDPVIFPARNEIAADVLRLDKINASISGNKWFKLRNYLAQAIRDGRKGIITFGGAWSNHLLATAAACSAAGLRSVGLVRGEPARGLTPLLQQVSGEYGMELFFLSRTAYSSKTIPPGYESGDYLLVPEGGYGAAGAAGAGTILDQVTGNYTHVCCAVGTGTMAAGLANRMGIRARLVGISVMKHNDALGDAINTLLTVTAEPELFHEYHFGGYAKSTPELIAFMNDFYKATNVPSDFVYTGKLFFAVNDLVARNYFPRGSRLLLIHSGGLQGNRSLPEGTLIF